MLAALIPTVIFGSIAVYQGYRATVAAEQSADADQAGKKRDEEEDRKNKELDQGPPVTVTAGDSPMYPTAFALKEQRFHVGPIANVTEWDGKFNAWLKSEEARPVGLYAVRFTVKALRDDTTIIQDFKLKDRDCPFEIAGVNDEKDVNYKGTLVYPPPMGGSGADVTRDVLGFDVGQYDENQARIVERGYPKRGSRINSKNYELFLRQRFVTKTVVLERNDARTFDVYFASGLECTFGLQMNVTSGGTDSWVDIDISPSWGDGKGGAALAPGYRQYSNLVRPVPGKGMAFPPIGSPERPFAPGVDVTGSDITP
ncbi:hypothetical protein [Streptomyces sp. NPDC093225]|uniref:hypothetical protein n=1 Tax=Streptomyces sp. NPDC093225 TaxID=3366034 RepID=UPI003815535A